MRITSHNKKRFVTLLAAALFAAPLPLLAQVAGPIHNASVDLAFNGGQGRITINGSGLPTSSAPSVRFGTADAGLIDLTVVSFSSTQIIANFPAAKPASFFPPGSYLLRVASTSGSFFLWFFEVALGAIGPQGPQGPQGPPGPQGATGPQGPQGLLVRLGQRDLRDQPGLRAQLDLSSGSDGTHRTVRTCWTAGTSGCGAQSASGGAAAVVRCDHGPAGLPSGP